MTSLTEATAEWYLAAHAFTPAWPGLIGLSVDLPSGTAASDVRQRLRHGFLATRATGVITVSGPPSPGLEVAAARMAEDLAAVGRPGGVGNGPAGVRVSLEAGTDDDRPTGIGHRWAVAHAVAPVLAAAFANSPGRNGGLAGWRSTRQAARAHLRPAGADSPAGAGGDSRAAWARTVLDSATGSPRTFRQWIRSGDGPPPALGDLDRHVRLIRPPVAARGHLVIDVADHRADGWLVPAAVISALIEDPAAGAEALAATAALRTEPDLWERAARDALTDPGLAAAARSVFPAAYAALARRAAPRGVRDAVAVFCERYVFRGRCPADDALTTGPAGGPA